MKTGMYLKRLIRRKHPFQVILFVTARCNFRCEMCFYWKEREAASPTKELTQGECEQISRTMKPFPWLLIGGGEPFLRKDLAEILGIFIKNNRVFHVTIPTNAWYTDRIIETTGNLCAAYPHVDFNIDLSLSGPPSLHDKVVGIEGAYHRFLETYESFRPLRRKYPNLGLGAIFTLAETSQSHWKETLRTLTECLHFDSVVLSKARGTSKDPDKTRVDVRRYREACDWLEARIQADVVPGFRGSVGRFVQAKDVVMHRLIERVSRGEGLQTHCSAARLSVVISEEGTVYPCELLKWPLGNLRDHGMNFQTVWKGGAAEKARERIRSSGCFCTHECHLTTNILFDPRLLSNVIREVIRIEFYRYRHRL